MDMWPLKPQYTRLVLAIAAAIVVVGLVLLLTD